MRSINPADPLVLGSGSPRRREILGGLGIPIRVVVAEVDERTRPGEGPPEYLARVVALKLGAVSVRVEAEDPSAILVADTIVVIDDEILGKPSDIDEAERLLGRLAGRAHRVMTRYALSTGPAFGQARVARTVETRVVLRAASREILRRYAETGEGLDKAGAYAAQGTGAFLVESLEGSYANVVGLPACEVVRDLQDLGLLGSFP